jgi:hypothetical protein
MNNNIFYRVCHHETLQGLWYNYTGEFTGLIHNDFNFCTHNKLEMDFDEELVGWLSATESLENLFTWFPKEDIVTLQEHGWFAFEFLTEQHKFYDKFKHYVIKQDTSIPISKYVLNDNGIYTKINLNITTLNS